MKMNSIGKFNSVIKDLRKSYNKKDYPLINMIGSVKIHGTNIGINYNFETKEVKIINKTSEIYTDSYGFFNWFNKNKSEILNIIENNFNYSKSVTIFGEWAGNGIQKDVGISEFKKAFYIFGIKKDNLNWIEPNILKKINIINKDIGIFNIWNFKTFNIKLDINDLIQANNQLKKITEIVEENDPIVTELSKIYNKKVLNRIGEGIVWWYKDNNKYLNFFKVKGDKHSKAKLYKFSRTDKEIENKKKDLAELITPAWRLNQAVNEVTKFEVNELLKWVFSDINKEEKETILNAGFKIKHLNNYITKRVIEFYKEEKKNEI